MNIKLPRLSKFLPLFFCCAAGSVHAATLINVVSNPGGEMKVMIDGNKSRIDMGARKGFVLIDYDKKTMLAVVPEQRQILDMSEGMPSMGGKPAPKLSIKLKPEGNGPKIAGYTTKKYTVIAEGKVCGTLFGSKAAMEATGLSRLFESMKEMAEKQRAAMGGYATMIDVCTRANMDFSSQGDTVGVPMKSLDARGKTTSEITSINTSATLPADAFDLPKGYTRVTAADQMRRAQQSMGDAQKQMPDMQQMMKQMQESGQMTPEAIEQMKRYQEMMQQQGR